MLIYCSLWDSGFPCRHRRQLCTTWFCDGSWLLFLQPSKTLSGWLLRCSIGSSFVKCPGSDPQCLHCLLRENSVENQVLVQLLTFMLVFSPILASNVSCTEIRHSSLWAIFHIQSRCTANSLKHRSKMSEPQPKSIDIGAHIIEWWSKKQVWKSEVIHKFPPYSGLISGKTPNLMQANFVGDGYIYAMTNTGVGKHMFIMLTFCGTLCSLHFIICYLVISPFFWSGYIDGLQFF